MVTLIIRHQKEALPLLQLGERAARNLDTEFQVIILCEEGPEEPIALNEKAPSWIKELPKLDPENTLYCGGNKRYKNTETHLKEHLPELLIIGKHLSRKPEAPDTAFSRRLYESLSCQTLLIRLGNQNTPSPPNGKKDSTSDESPCRSPILVSCGRGSHTRRALRLAHALAGEDVVAYHLRADVDDVSAEYAHSVLTEIVKKSDLDPDSITLKSTLGTDIPSALREQIAEGHQGCPYAMLLLGDSANRGLREKLFGTIPDKLINKSDGLTIGVIRAEHPPEKRLRNFFSNLLRTKTPQLTREERIALFNEIEYKSRWTFDFAALMTLAALVAGLGLLANSAAVVIGAMLIAPLMMPLIGSGLALAQGHWPLFKNALSAVIRGFLFALLVGLILGLLARFFHIPLTDELAARGNPTLLDLGVALVSGIAAAYCIARPTLSGALAGVAIAAALVPPIVTVGISLTLREMPTAKGASLLFGTNVVAVILGAAINFLLAGIRGHGQAGSTSRRFLIILTLACLGLAVPLTTVLLKKVPRLTQTHHTKQQLENLITKELPDNTKLLSPIIETVEDQQPHYHLTIQSPAPLDKALHHKILETLKKEHPHHSPTLTIETKLILE